MTWKPLAQAGPQSIFGQSICVVECFVVVVVVVGGGGGSDDGIANMSLSI